MDTTQPEEAVVDAPDVETPATEDATVEQTTSEDLYADDQPVEADDDEPGDEEGGEDEGEGESDEPDEDTGPAIDAPLSWKAEEKEAFSKLPRDIQEVVARREADRERFVQTKAQEAAQVRQQAIDEAMTAVQTLRQQQAEELENFAAQIVPQKPPIELMAEDPDAYVAETKAYEYWTAQRQHAQQLAHQRRQEAAYLQQQQAEQVAALEAQQTEAILREQFPEYLDPNEGPKLREELGAVAIELGYSPEQLASVDARDIIAMRKVSVALAKAAKWDALQKDKMAGVRAAKQLRPLVKPGAPSAARQRTTDPVKLLYPND